MGQAKASDSARAVIVVVVGMLECFLRVTYWTYWSFWVSEIAVMEISFVLI